MKKTVLIIVGIALIIGALGIWYFLQNYRRVTHERELPAQGEARYNPLYALKVSLKELGQSVESHARLDLENLKLAENDTLVLYSPPNGVPEKQLDDLLEWVEHGGHLIVSAPSQALLSDEITLYTKLGIYPAEAEKDCFNYLPVSKNNLAQLCGNRFFTEDIEWFSWLRGDEKHGYSLGRMEWGDGTVTVTSSLRFMSNQQLNTAGARELTYQLLANTMGKGHFHLVYAADISPFWLLLLKHGWSLLVPLLILLLAWLVYRSQRFGPLQASPNPDRRALLEHISATGEYMFHRHLAHELHLVVLGLVTARLRRRDPFTAALTGEAQVIALAERTKIDPQKIRQALKPGSLRQKENFFHSIATLIQLRNQL
ncbi:MAG: DUF4350 domain-containing protein [Arenimonas sp.]